MDFIIGLPKTRFHHDLILVVIDTLTKVAYFILANTTNNTPIMENMFSHEIFRLHRFPEVIISNRGSKFTSVCWKSLHKVLGTKLNMILVYHPKIDGQTEWVNRVLEDMLKTYYMEQKTKFYLVEFAYNNGYHSSLRMAPFKDIYDRKCKTPLSWDNKEDQVMI